MFSSTSTATVNGADTKGIAFSARTPRPPTASNTTATMPRPPPMLDPVLRVPAPYIPSGMKDELGNDIPNVAEEARKLLASSGIARLPDVEKDSLFHANDSRLASHSPRLSNANFIQETKTDPLLAPGGPKLDLSPYVKWEENHAAVLHYLKSIGVTSFVEEKEDDPMGAIEHLTKVIRNIPEDKIFNIDTKEIIEESEHAGFYQSSTIPFHLLAVISLLVGKCPKRHIFVGTEKRWKNASAHCLQVCKNPQTAEQVLKMVVTTHAKETQSTYKLLFVCSLQPKICSVRGPAIYHWIESMNSKIDDAWSRYKAQLTLMLRNLACKDKLAAGNTSNVNPIKPDDEDGFDME